MAVEVRLDLDAWAVDDLAYDDEVEDLLDEVGEDIADLAAELARPDELSGAGAASIHGETSLEPGGWVVDVSWDQRNFYMGFQEEGTEHHRAQPFLRPAFESYRL